MLLTMSKKATLGHVSRREGLLILEGKSASGVVLTEGLLLKCCPLGHLPIKGFSSKEPLSSRPC